MNRNWLKYLWKIALAGGALFIFTLAIKALYRLTHTIHLGDVVNAIEQIPTIHLIIAFFVVAFGYLLLTLYDFIALKQIQQKVPYARVALTAYTAYAISHTVGANVITASGIRYRFYTMSGLKSSEIANIVWLVSMAFSFGISTLVGLSLTVSPEITLRLLSNLDRSLGFFDNAIYIQALGVTMLTIIMGLILWSGKTGKHLIINGWRFDLPPAKILFQQIIIAILDLSTVALVLYLLLPAHAHITYLQTFSAFIQSMAIGILSHVPGGLGVFEVTMLASFPKVDKAQMLGALLIFRIYYYILPFIFAILLLGAYETRRYLRKVEVADSRDSKSSS